MTIWKEPEARSSEWPEPQPLSAKVAPMPYPEDALPDAIRAAVDEVHSFVQAPYPLVACSALGALSLACQVHVDVRRAEKLQGPSSLYLLAIADSGERKSTCDGFFISPIRQYQAEQIEAAKPAQSEYWAEMSAWEARRDGILSTIKAAGRGGRDTETLRSGLVRHHLSQPQAPRVPRIILGDETPESLAWSLAKLWPSSGIMSSEAGTVFGSHGMGKESIVRNLGVLNEIWGGGELSFGRKTSECFTVRGARLTMALQVQEATLRDFIDKSGALARGSGFLARFLVAWPESTIGKRAFKENLTSWRSLGAFHVRLAEILNRKAPVGDDGALSPAALGFTPEAKAAWVAFYNAIEAGLLDGGELHEVRDVASKAADNAARLAALFHVLGKGAGSIGIGSLAPASRIVAWHLGESRRFFGEMAQSKEIADAMKLESWLLGYCRRQGTHMAGKSHVIQCGPNPLRDKRRLDAAIAELEALGRLRVLQEGRRVTLQASPALLAGAP
ncbi:MAG: DUF3987 domain-containing protein [Azoarcus sp.]|jgi:putative DNA primase/helicase|nr:DUF3987 domain-containing protein [Azoarcus sp.]